jgi:DNA-binding Xre family transcriptional regulator
MSAISVRLGHLRVARGLTQQQLADHTGLRRDTISALERGKSQAIEFGTLARLCDALDVGASDILALAPTAHTAPILGGDDEDAIIAERRAEADSELAAILADPERAAAVLTGEFALSAPPVTGTDRAHTTAENSITSLTDQAHAAGQGTAALVAGELVPTEARS